MADVMLSVIETHKGVYTISGSGSQNSYRGDDMQAEEAHT